MRFLLQFIEWPIEWCVSPPFDCSRHSIGSNAALFRLIGALSFPFAFDRSLSLFQSIGSFDTKTGAAVDPTAFRTIIEIKSLGNFPPRHKRIVKLLSLFCRNFQHKNQLLFLTDSLSFALLSAISVPLVCTPKPILFVSPKNNFATTRTMSAKWFDDFCVLCMAFLSVRQFSHQNKNKRWMACNAKLQRFSFPVLLLSCFYRVRVELRSK